MSGIIPTFVHQGLVLFSKLSLQRLGLLRGCLLSRFNSLPGPGSFVIDDALEARRLTRRPEGVEGCRGCGCDRVHGRADVLLVESDERT